MDPAHPRIIPDADISLDQNQEHRFVSPEFDTLIVFLKEFFEKVNFEKSQQTTTKA